MVAQNTWANLVYGANVVHTAANGVKSMGNDVESLENNMISPRDAINPRETLGHFSSSRIETS